jgi:two-component system sensor histidine kinase ChvG
MATGWFEVLFGSRTLQSTQSTARELARVMTADPAALEREVGRAAAGRKQWVRVFDLEGNILASANHWGDTGWYQHIGDLLYGPTRARAQARWEEERGPIHTRPEVKSARESGWAERCDFYQPGNLYTCTSVAAIPLSEGVRIVHVQESSRRALQGLYESRRQLVKLLLFALALGLGVAWWMTSGIIRPIERLRGELLQRATEAVPRAGIDIGRRDELGDLSDAFNTVLAALGERTRANEAFLANLAHEFKNPVAAIRAAAERLPDTRPDDTERLARLSEAVAQSAQRLEALLSELLELARAEAGLPDEPRELVDLEKLLQGLCAALKSDPRYASLRIDLVTPGRPVERTGVPLRLEQLFRNLLENAASFAGENGWVRVELSEPAKVTVEDSGPGIAPENLGRVFDRFFTTRPQQRGTGLGLALARAVAEAHGGRIRAESPEGRGALFTVDLG